MSSVGYGDIVPRNNTETGFQMLVVITGACLFAALVGCIGVLLKEEDRKTDLEFRRKKAQLQNYFRTKNLPQNLVRTIEANFVAMWKTRVDLNHQSESDGALLEAASSTEAQRTDSAIYVDKQYQKRLLRELPIGLRADIAFAAKRDVVQTIHYLRSLDEVAQRLIALELQVMYCYSNTILYQRGDQAHNVFFIMQGVVRCTRESSSDEPAKKGSTATIKETECENTRSLDIAGQESKERKAQNAGIGNTASTAMPTMSGKGTYPSKFAKLTGTRSNKMATLTGTGANGQNKQVFAKHGLTASSSRRLNKAARFRKNKMAQMTGSADVSMENPTPQVALDSGPSGATLAMRMGRVKDSVASEGFGVAHAIPSAMLNGNRSSRFRLIGEGYHFGHEPLTVPLLTSQQPGKSDASKLMVRQHDAITSAESTLYLIEISTLQQILKAAHAQNPRQQSAEEMLIRLSIAPEATDN
eukprot:INCI511.1.p1 GENE.INCI511.1~~INCI511.1.p1  ORF type:complete len:544 (+),score=82.01 INCI511.1:222-1634(+)